MLSESICVFSISVCMCMYDGMHSRLGVSGSWRRGAAQVATGGGGAGGGGWCSKVADGMSVRLSEDGL